MTLRKQFAKFRNSQSELCANRLVCSNPREILQGGHVCTEQVQDRVRTYAWSQSPMITFLLWCLLFVLSWPLAILALICFPFVWLLLLPFRLLGIAVHGAFALVAAILFLPARLLRAIA